MNYELDLLFPTPIMLFDNLIDNDNLTVIKNWLINYFKENNSTREQTFSPLATVNSSHKWDPFLQKRAELKPLVSKILEASKIMLNNMGYIECAEHIIIKDMWAYIGDEGDYVQPHIHQNSIISGAYYLQVPDNCYLMFKDYTNMFKMPDRWNKLNRIQEMYPLKNNKLILFRSDAVHGTGKIPPGLQKITISFNITFEYGWLIEGGPTQNPRSTT